MNNKKGNILIIVVCIFVVLIVILGSLLKTTTNRAYTAKKLDDSLLAKEYANSLALLAVHHIKSDLIKPNSSLKNILSLPYNQINGKKGEIKASDFNIDISGKSIADALKPSSGPTKIDLAGNKIYWELNNFTPINVGKQIPHEMEKFGLIHITFQINIKQPGKKSIIKENYHFASEIRVVANLLPVLSKFTLYIEDALDGNGNPHRFNVIDTDENGNLHTNSAKPWVLNNFGEDVDSNPPNTFETLLENPRGFVYLGGGNKDKPIQLGVAAGGPNDNGQYGDYGEDFHFYMNTLLDEGGFWRTLEPLGEGAGVMFAETGFYQVKGAELDLDDEDDKEIYSEYLWYLDLLDDEADYTKFNSIFKLYGTDNIAKSPTLVFGFVNSLYASLMMFKCPDQIVDKVEPEFFNNCNQNEFNIAIKKEDDITDEEEQESYDNFNLKYFLKYKGSSYNNFNEYKNKYASRVRSSSYNRDYFYCINRSVEWPMNSIEERLQNFCRPDSPEKINVPTSNKARYGDIYGSNVNLSNLSDFINEDNLAISPDGPRIAYYLKINDNPDSKGVNSIYSTDTNIERDFINYLESKGIIVNNEINFNGWLYIDNPANINLNINLANKKLISHGGIILSNGSININSNILSDNGSHLTIIALGKNKEEGKCDIVVKNNAQLLNASLISKYGQVKLEGENKLQINGNIIMKKVGCSDKKADENQVGMRRGLYLKYLQNLSAVPFVNDAREKALLMFNIKENPKMY